MAFGQYPFWIAHPRKRRIPDRRQPPEPGAEQRTIAVERRRPAQHRQLNAGVLAAEIDAFRLYLAAEGKAPGTVRNYTSAVRWFAGGWLCLTTSKSSWAQVEAGDVERWMEWLLGRYSRSYARSQYVSLRQFFTWLSHQRQLRDPMPGLRQPTATVKVIPVFTSLELSKLAKACQGRSFADRRDAAIIAVFLATGIRLAELAGIHHHSDLDLESREIRVCGKGGKERIVRITHEAAHSLDRYLRARARHPHARQPQLWLGARGALTAGSIYQIVAARGRLCGVKVFPQRFRHHFSHTWLDRGGPEADLMALNGWSSPQMLTHYGAGARSARARRSYDRVMAEDR
jgi:site-specific recombinase XerD